MKLLKNNDLVRCEMEGEVAVITLDRPDTGNALDVDMAIAFGAAVSWASDAKGSVILLRAEGKNFCVGGDIAYMAKNVSSLSDAVGLIVEPLHNAISKLRNSPKIVISSIHGATAGAGLSLAISGDICIAAKGTIFKPAYASLGVSPDAGGAKFLSEVLGRRQAFAFLALDEKVSVDEAKDMGLVQKIVDRVSLHDCSSAIAQSISENARAIQETKELVNHSRNLTVDEHLASEKKSLLSCFKSQLAITRVRSFGSRL